MGSRPDLTGLTVLALLAIRPCHPYELHRFITDTHKDYITGLPRSLYHAVERLTREELIAPVERLREGRRPERTVYEITDEGRAELSTRLRRLLETPDSDFRLLFAAISLMGVLSPEDVIRSLKTRSATLDGMIVSADAHLDGLRVSGLPKILLVELECARAIRTAEREWIRGLLADLESKTLTWTSSLRSGLLEQVLDGGPHPSADD